MEFNFEFSNDDIKIIERLIGYSSIKQSTREDIMSFLEKYKFRKKFYELEGKYVRFVENLVDGGDYRQEFFMYIEKIEEKEIGDRLRLVSDQIIRFDYNKDNILVFSRITTTSKEIREKYPDDGYGVHLDIDFKNSDNIKIIEISQSNFEDELVKAININ